MLLRLKSPRIENELVRTCQEMLNFLGFRYTIKSTAGQTVSRPLLEDGIYGEETDKVVIHFQRSEGLLRDGIVGPNTMQALEKAWTERHLELDSPGMAAVDGMPDRHTFVRVAADPCGQGYDRLLLRDDVAEAYQNVLKEVRRHKGILTSSGGIRNLNATTNSSRSRTSMHYLGRALDLYIYSGMVDPDSDPYVITQEPEERRYRVHARIKGVKKGNRTTTGTEPSGKIVTYDSRKGTLSCKKDRFLDLTKLFEAHGFKPIRARRQFDEGASMMMGAEWWHFQYEKGLLWGITTFGSELLKVYSKSTLEGTAPWEHRDRVFGINWSARPAKHTQEDS